MAETMIKAEPMKAYDVSNQRMVFLELMERSDSLNQEPSTKNVFDKPSCWEQQ